MKTNVSFLIVWLAVFLAGCSSYPAYASEARGQKPNLLIMGEDFDKDTVPRDSPRSAASARVEGSASPLP